MDGLASSQRHCHYLYFKSKPSTCKSLASNIHFHVMFYQPTPSAIRGAIQLGIGYVVGNLNSKPDRDVLMQDFSVVESVFLPR